MHCNGCISHIHVIYYDLILVRTFSHNSKAIYRIPGSRYFVLHAKVFGNVGSLTADAYTPLENFDFCNTFKTPIHKYGIYNNTASAENCNRFHP